ncbi:hypothetical protein PMAYCL1PPCAC_28352, partial [Pristionchus mayeri]
LRAGLPWHRPSSSMLRGLLLGLLLLGTVLGGQLTIGGLTPVPGGEFTYNKEFMSGLLQAFMSPKGVNMTRLLETFNPTPCLQTCMPTLSQFLDSFNTKQSLRDTKDTVALCRQLESIDECAARAKCDSQLLDLATKTYKFACVDKIESIGDSLRCAQEAFSSARTECEAGCITDRRSSTLGFDPSKLPVDVASVCESSVCLLGCMQRSINSACLSRGNTPSLFNAILTTSTSSDDSTLSSLLSGLLPAHCREILKAQDNLPDRLAHLAGIAKDSPPISVGKPRAAAATTPPTTTVTTTTTTVAQMTSSSTTTPNPNPLAWAPEPIEVPIDIDGDARTLSIRVLDWERRPVGSPNAARLAQLIAEQLLKQEDMQMRAADDEDDSSADADAAFRRWAHSHDAESYKGLGFGARSAGDEPTPLLRSANSSPDFAPSILPSWTNLVAAGIFPFVIYLMD